MKKIAIIITLSLLLFKGMPVQGQQSDTKIVAVVLNLLLQKNTVNKVLSVTWDRPISREDETTLILSDIDYYRIRYRNTTSEQTYLTTLIDSPNSAAQLVLDGQLGDEYEIAIQTVDINGFSSDYTDSILVSF